MKNGKGYKTYAMSYGAKSFSKNPREIYLERIIELKKNLAIDNSEKQNKEITAWLVKCAENEITRWEGIYDLYRSGCYSSYENRINFINYLTNEQKNKLFTILKSAMSGENGMPPSTYYIMSILSKATKNKNLDHIVNLYRKIDYYDKKKVKIERKLADEFITKLIEKH